MYFQNAPLQKYKALQLNSPTCVTPHLCDCQTKGPFMPMSSRAKMLSFGASEKQCLGNLPEVNGQGPVAAPSQFSGNVVNKVPIMENNENY